MFIKFNINKKLFDISLKYINVYLKVYHDAVANFLFINTNNFDAFH